MMNQENKYILRLFFIKIYVEMFIFYYSFKFFDNFIKIFKGILLNVIDYSIMQKMFFLIKYNYVYNRLFV